MHHVGFTVLMYYDARLTNITNTVSVYISLPVHSQHRMLYTCYMVMEYHLGIQECYVSGKAIPVQAWTSPDSNRRLILPDFKTVGT
jgi:hypothetical protein